MNITILAPYLNFNGNCKEAMEFYQSVLGGKLDVQMAADVPGGAKNANKDLVIHALLASNSMIIMASDGPDGAGITFGNSVHLSLSGEDETALNTYFSGLSAGGQVDMPLAKQFWGDTFGMLTDKYGIHWMVNIAATLAANDQPAPNPAA
jgi:PhnB protein